ncbi:hypothetical protein CYLTODRAFT_377968 [Cylindrobasidium torrendii FP15055 ss-10]|uniref:EI24-domain-containing protein n=1 Tax=Cylindrobasidium torrendii FP15055 ss-10 TaxID=1314674 RepID=A0A0D7B9V2_9AGAR|nr:hypothetical protein CYLTODRAFT_377968 [Cylindrobasidium torrendii FP15055 ss-10]
MSRRSTGYDSRSTYPNFLSLQETLRLQLGFALAGLREGLRWDIVISAVARDPEIQSNVIKSVLLNSLSLASIYTFDLLLRPLFQNQAAWFHRNLGWFYQVFWVMPVISVSLYLNSSWSMLIARRVYTLQHGPRALAQHQPTTYSGILTTLATSAYRAVMVVTSVMVSFLLAYTPIIGPLISFIYLSWVDSYYFFEFIWIARGLSLSRRIRFLEERWVYFLGFGMPSAAICSIGSGLANGAIFALIYPAFIIMAIHARPTPSDPYSPTETESVIHPSPFVPIRLRIFAPVLLLNDTIVRVLSVGGGGGHRRTGSGDSSELVEEGTHRITPKMRRKLD